MLLRVQNNIKANFGFVIYLIILLFLSFGVAIHSGAIHLPKMGLVIFSFIIFYVLQKKLFAKKAAFNFKFNDKFANLGYYSLIGIAILIFIIDIIILKGLPGFHLFSTTTEIETTELRNNIHSNSHTIFVYLNSLNLKVFFPLAILFSFIKKQKWLFITLTIVGSVYCFGMLQKSYILSMLLPILLYLILNKKYILIGVFTLLIATNFTVIIIGSSGKIQDDIEFKDEASRKKALKEQQEIESQRSWIFKISYGITHRIFVTPGEMVSEWFETIPSKMPFLNGAGYPLIPRITNVPYVDYDKELYPIIRPEYAERNISGSVNSATFMREYSNFGIIGLVLSSLFVALFIGLLDNLFLEDFKMFITINLINILYLSSANLWTLLFSGGWAISLIIYIVLRPKKNLVEND